MGFYVAMLVVLIAACSPSPKVPDPPAPPVILPPGTTAMTAPSATLPTTAVPTRTPTHTPPPRFRTENPGTPLPPTAGPTDYHAAYRIVFHACEYEWITIQSALVQRINRATCEIYQMDADGSNPVPLTDNDWMDCCPAASPDGTTIAMISDRDGNDEIYLMSTDGSGLARLTHTNYREAGPAWSPDGARIVYTAHHPNDDSELKWIRADGSQEVMLAKTEAGKGYFSSPAWSPDGTKIVYGLTEYVGRGSSSVIFAMNADGSGVVQLTVSSFSENPAWSPDGGKIAFEAWGGNNIVIYTMNPDSSSMLNLSRGEGWDSHPSWSPDGRMIAFASDRGHETIGRFDIYVMNADGGGQTRLTFNEASFEPSWLFFPENPFFAHLDCTSGWTQLADQSEPALTSSP